MSDEQLNMNMKDIDFIDGDGDLTDEARTWYLDICDGRIELPDPYRPIFEQLRLRALHGTFYDSAVTAYVYEFARVQARFAAMVAELED